MPEGPSLVLLKEELQPFKGKKVLHASGNQKKFDNKLLDNKKITDIKTWGKRLLLCFGEDLTVRIHLLMFGTCYINERHGTKEPRLQLQFAGGKEINFYTCSVQLLDAPPDEVFDWSADVMNEAWDAKGAIKKLKAKPEALVCDVLLDQDIFSGVGNIIKNEVLFRIKVHPESKVGALPSKKLKELVDEAVNYTFDFLKWKREFTLRAHWLAHNKKVCPRDHVPFHKGYPGRLERRSFWCTECQKLYT